MAERAPRSLIARSAAASREGRLRARLDNAADQGPRRQHGADPRQTPALCQRGAVAAQSIPQARALRQGPWPTCGALGSAQDFQPPRWGAMCVSLSTGRLAGRQGDKAALRLLRRAGDGLRSASRRLLRRPSFWAQASRGRWPTPVRWRRSAARHRVTRIPSGGRGSRRACLPFVPGRLQHRRHPGIRPEHRQTFHPRRQACRNSAPTSAVHSGGSGTVFEIAASTQGCSAASMAICADGAISAARRK